MMNPKKTPAYSTIRPAKQSSGSNPGLGTRLEVGLVLPRDVEGDVVLVPVRDGEHRLGWRRRLQEARPEVLRREGEVEGGLCAPAADLQRVLVAVRDAATAPRPGRGLVGGMRDKKM